MAELAVAQHGVSIALACRTFGISETCYRYQPLLNAENERIADLLVGLTQARRNWGFGLCFLYLRNVKEHPWNHKRVYRIYRELELNLRIKPRKRLKREKPEELVVPDAPNVTWSILARQAMLASPKGDFMADRLEDSRAFRLLNVVDPCPAGDVYIADRGLQSRGFRHRSGLLAADQPCHSISEPDHRMARQA
jgi:putative transposase